MKQFQNRQFSISLSQNTLRGQISSVLAGSDPGRLAPYGYDREIVGPDGSVLYRIRFTPGGDRQVLDRQGRLQATYAKGQSLKKPGKECRARLVLSEPNRVRVVRDIFRHCVDGVGFKGIADALQEPPPVTTTGRACGAGRRNGLAALPTRWPAGGTNRSAACSQATWRRS